jgi:acyl-CoA thioester hydrolase
MFELRMADFKDRVFTSTERVKFTQADPYGHLATGRYVDVLVSHRVEAFMEQAGVSLLHVAQTQNVAFAIRNVSVQLLLPCKVGDALEAASWAESFTPNGLKVRGVISGKEGRVRAVGTIDFITVDLRTGRPVALPESLPSRAEEDPLPKRPTPQEYLKGLQGVPESW